MKTPAAPVFYFSLRSPYSWLAHEDLHEHHPDVLPLLEWRPFWEPDARSEAMLTEAGGRFVYTPMSREKHLYILQDVRRLAADRGLSVAWPVDREPHWEVPHLAYLAAREQGLGAEFVALAYQARWQEGRDICDPAVMVELGTKLGLDGERFARSHEDEGLRQQGLLALLDIYRDDVFGVPFFRYGRAKFWGVDRLPAFVRSFQAVPARPDDLGPEDQGLALARTTDFGPAGGCG